MVNLTHVQNLHLELLRHANHNDLDGQVVVDGLLANRDLWWAVISAHSYHPHPVYRMFEEFEEDTWASDVLWILAVNEAAAKQLITLCIQKWKADEADIVNPKERNALSDVTLDAPEVLIRVWWD
jgi:hypothetical protein